MKKYQMQIIICLLLSLLFLTLTARIHSNGNPQLKNSKSPHFSFHETGFDFNFSYNTVINASDYPGENDTERLQAALDDVPPEGAVVIISPRIWTACGLTAKSRTVIQGCNGTVIRRPENTTEPFITFENKTEFAVLNITFDGANISEAWGVRIIGCKSFLISNNKFINIKKSALKVFLNSLNQTAGNFVISNNYFDNCDIAPLFLFGIPGQRKIRDFLIINNTVVNGWENGKIAIGFVDNGAVINNTVTNCQYGIATRCISNILIEGNLVYNVTDYGIYLGTQIGDFGTENVTIRSNTIVNGTIGITRYYGSQIIQNVSLVNNKFLNNTLYDIRADFPAFFVNTTITANDKLMLVDGGAFFRGTKTIAGEPIVPGDVFPDNKIDIRDVASVSAAYGTQEGSPNWNPELDIIQDGVVDIKDISYVAHCFGIIE